MKRDLVLFGAGMLLGGLLLAGCGRKSTPPAAVAPQIAPATGGQVAERDAAFAPAVAQQPVAPPTIMQPGIGQPAPAAVAANEARPGTPARPVPARPRDERQDEVPIIRELRRSLAEVEVENEDDRKSIGSMFDEAEPQLRRVLGKNSLRAIQQANQRMPFVVIEPPRKPPAKPRTPDSTPTPTSPTPRPSASVPVGE
ncbi:MAG: hypothetical protein AB7U73_14940 [Pirellulales bacterium]